MFSRLTSMFGLFWQQSEGSDHSQQSENEDSDHLQQSEGSDHSQRQGSSSHARYTNIMRRNIVDGWYTIKSYRSGKYITSEDFNRVRFMLGIDDSIKMMLSSDRIDSDKFKVVNVVMNNRELKFPNTVIIFGSIPTVGEVRDFFSERYNISGGLIFFKDEKYSSIENDNMILDHNGAEEYIHMNIISYGGYTQVPVHGPNGYAIIGPRNDCKRPSGFVDYFGIYCQLRESLSIYQYDRSQVVHVYQNGKDINMDNLMSSRREIPLRDPKGITYDVRDSNDTKLNLVSIKGPMTGETMKIYIPGVEIMDVRNWILKHYLTPQNPGYDLRRIEVSVVSKNGEVTDKDTSPLINGSLILTKINTEGLNRYVVDFLKKKEERYIEAQSIFSEDRPYIDVNDGKVVLTLIGRKYEMIVTVNKQPLFGQIRRALSRKIDVPASNIEIHADGVIMNDLDMCEWQKEIKFYIRDQDSHNGKIESHDQKACGVEE